MAGCRAGAAESSGYGVAGVVCGCGGGSLLEQQPAIEAGGEVGVALARLSHHQLHRSLSGRERGLAQCSVVLGSHECTCYSLCGG